MSNQALPTRDKVVLPQRIETRYLSVLVVLRTLHLIPDSEVQCEVAQYLPIILHIERVNPVAGQTTKQILSNRIARHRADEKLRDRVTAGVGYAAAVSIQSIRSRQRKGAGIVVDRVIIPAQPHQIVAPLK